jgi:hypothetical protein
MSFPPHTTLSPTDRSRLSTKSSKPCYNVPSTNIRPTGIICCFPLWSYRMAVKTATSFTPFHLIHGIEATLPIECEIPTLRTAIELLPDTAPMEQHLLTLESLDEDRRSSLQNNEAAKKWSKSTFDRHVNLRSFNEGDLMLAYISPMIPSAMGNLSHYGMDPTSSNTASLRVHTSWPLQKATLSKNPSTGCT